MISVIVCSQRPSTWDMHQRNVQRTVGSPCEYIRVDNTAGQYGICAAYNRGIERARGDVFVFVHEDVFFLNMGWGATLETRFRADATLGLVGVAGTQYLFRHNPAWHAAGRPFLRGRVVHEADGVQEVCLYSRDRQDTEVVAADGLFLAIRGELFRHIRFDEACFDQFDFYDMDICMQVRQTHRLIVTCEILVKHLSGGSFDEAWRRYAGRFLAKYAERLPASCCADLPDSRHPVDYEACPIPQYLPTIV